MDDLRMEAVEVGLAKSGLVRIEQNRDHQREDPAVIVIHHSQVETLCDFLRQARDEAVEWEAERKTKGK